MRRGIEYRAGVPFFNYECGACVSGDYVDPRCPACVASQNRRKMEMALHGDLVPYVTVSAAQVRKVTIVRAEARVPISLGELDAEVPFLAEGTATCDEYDEPSAAIGFELALGRALTDLGRQMKRRAWDQVYGKAL